MKAKTRSSFLRLLAITVACIFSFEASAQVYPLPSNSWGIYPRRGVFDSTFFGPTGCGVPTDSTYLFSIGYGNGEIMQLFGLYYDSCGHHLYVWDPALEAWHCTDCATGTGGSSFSMHGLSSTNFSTATNCPLPALNNDSIQIFWNDVGRFLQEGTEWQNLSGGGFSILVPGFNASTSSYSLTLYANNVASPPGPQNFTSSNFTSSVNCPIPTYNGMTLTIYWNDAQRYLVQGTDWTPLAGGGFTITISGFNASTSNYSFYVFAQ